MSEKEEQVRALLYAYQMLCKAESHQRSGLGMADEFEEGKLDGIKTSRSTLEDAIIDHALE